MKKIILLASLAFSINAFAQVPSYVPTNGLVGWWPFSGNANDGSTNGYNGTVNGATLTSDRFGNSNKAYNFDGIDDSISTSFNGILGQNPRSISFWARTNSITEMTPIIYGSNNLGERYNATFNYVSQGLAIGTGNSAITYNTQSSIADNNWHHYTYVLQQLSSPTTEDFQLFQDGVLLNVPNHLYNSTSLINTTIGYPLIFGGTTAPGNLNVFFNGDLDDIGMWNRALSAQEISDLYNSNPCSNELSISPTSSLQNIGANSPFSATTSDPNATYLWQSDLGQGFQTLNNYGNYSGVNTNTLTISNVQLSNHNQPFRLIANSGSCSDTSNIATIQIADTCITNVTVYDTLLTTVTDTLIIYTTLSLPAPNNENTILIYPNPASDHITIDNGNFAAMAGYSIKITNNAGQEVFLNAINQQQFYVDLSTWSGNGLYFVHLIDSQNNTVTVRKIVLQ
jgi:hypothetical protein